MGVIDLDARVKKLEAEGEAGGAVVDQLEAAVTALEEATGYSTTEHVVGTWIDDSPVYEKTVVLENVNYATANTNYTVMEIPDLAVPVSLSALFSNSAKTVYHMSPYVATDEMAKKSFFDFDSTNSLIFFTSQDTWGSTNMIVTARYTKASTPTT